MTRSSLTAGVMCAVLLSAMVSPVGARTVKQKKQAARAQFEVAERLRDALLGTPESDRDRGDYLKVIEAYRKVYYTAPSWARADAAVLAVAELLDDQGRVLHDEKSYKDAIGQLAFLRREYPGSTHRVEALFTIAQIYRDDLKDNEQAQATFQDFLKRYPGSSLAPKARKELAELGDIEAKDPFRRKPRHKQESGPEPKVAWAEPEQARPKHDEVDRASAKSARSEKAKDEKVADDEQVRGKSDAESPSASKPAVEQNAALGAAAQPLGRLPRLTSVRHWSTPDYVRVVIDLEQEVQYRSGRVPRPDRIFFDLYGVKLASDLVGKSFDVEAGFLHRIRVSQYKANMARVVLDVDDVAEYSAFLLPNPYRLIIDIHGKTPAGQQSQVANNAGSNQDAKSQAGQANDSGENDVTVRHVAPSARSRPNESAASALQHAAEAQAGPAKSLPATTTEVAKAAPPKVVADDDDTSDTPDADKTASKPTTGPTYEAVAPRQSSRIKKRKAARASDDSEPASTAHVAAPTANGERSLIRALGLKIGKIVVDAGHGGHDTGTVGPNGLKEKDLVLDVALRLGKLLEKKLGAEVVYTRDDDTFIPLETRTAIANKEQADLFISVHANSSSDPSARGVETYYLNFTSSRDALETAARENAVSEKSIHELQDLVKKIALKEKIQESREFAADVQRSLYNGLNARNPGLKNRGVKKAPFIVLIGANMPSILAEISFVSNPNDERKLKASVYRQRIAESLYKGIANYINGLSGVKVASRLERQESAAAMAAK
ncbi:MAG TPA: N-acetylmuramoyl-L-alanine amidase [Terriglobales bacterium]|nr:N-acetylmuramoyl-L-alanine amidase [Terriglobales bacterium]